MKHLYERDYPTLTILLVECRKWYLMGYQVFIHGYSAGQCEEYRP